MYNAHKLFYQPSPLPCLKSALILTEDQREKLERARKLVRARLREKLPKASDYAQSDQYYSADYLSRTKVGNTKDKSLSPRFRTQGSWAYDTLNQPAQTGQQIDLDDGMYLPMSIFEGTSPAVASTTLYSIVETILGELCVIHGWTMDTTKNICIRLEIDKEAHIDLNIYAVPDEKVEQLEKNMATESSIYFAVTRDFRLDHSEVYVAHRKKGWEQSDPLQLEDWFLDAVKRHKSWTDLRRTVRYLKAWRDQRWPFCRLSSLTLMVCAVEALDEANTPPLPNRDDDGLLVVARALSKKLASTIFNPVVKNSKLNGDWTTEDRNEFELSARILAAEMEEVIKHEATAAGVVTRLRKLFGSRMPNDISLVSPIENIEKIRNITPAQAPSPRVGTSTSG